MENTIPIQLSKRVTALRIILISFVIIRHNTIFTLGEPAVTSWIKEFFSNGMLYGNVALSFIFSGYFLAIKKHNYIDIVKRKFCSLIIPYILWTLFYFLVYIVLFHTNALHKYSQAIFKMDKWSLKNVVKMALGYGAYLNTPALAPQLWFIRDLIIFSVIYPVFMYLYDFRKKYCIAFTLTIITAMGFLYGKGLHCIRIGFYPILFFAAGIIFGMYKINFFELTDKLKYLDLVAGISILVIMNKVRPNLYPCFVPLLRFLSSLFWLKFSKYLVEHEKIFSKLKKLSVYSFFIYAVHFKILVLAIQKIFYLVPGSVYSTGGGSMLMYILAPVLTFGISLFLGIGVKKVAPKFFSIITGGRA